MEREFARYWPLEPGISFLTHGTYGATPWPVLHAQSEWRTRMEREPVRFMNEELEPALDAVRARLGDFLGADPEDLAFVPNATTGVSTVLRSIDLRAGDEILTTDHDYNACINAVRETCRRTGASYVVAAVPFPVASEDDIVEAILERAGPRTRLALISHVTSPTALVFPVERIVAELAERGIETLVDGAHAPGMLPVRIDRIGSAYYTGNAHKWLCAPKGSGFLHVRRDRQDGIRPLVISHGANSPRRERSRFRLEFDWTGTVDATAYLAIPAALDFVAGLLPDGWSGVMARNRQTALYGHRRLLEAVGSQPAAPESMLGSMAAVEIPAGLPPAALDPAPDAAPESTWPLDPLRDDLLQEHSIEVPVYAWPHTAASGGAARRRLLRISAQLYNDAADYDRLAAVLAELRAATPSARAG